MKILTYIRNIVIFGLSALLLVFYTGTISNDFIEYQLIFDYIATSEGVVEAIVKYRYEPGFTILYYSLSDFVTADNAFFIIALTILLIKYLIFIKYLNYPIAAWFLYVILFMPVLDASQQRTAVASTMIIYVLLTSQTKGGYIFKAVAASMFHYIALIIFTFQLYKKPIFTFLLVLLGAFLFDTILGLVSNNIFKVDMFISNPSHRNVNLLSSVSMAQLFLSLYCIINWKGFTDTQKKGGMLIMFGLLLYFVLAHNPGVAHRVREVSLLGIFPLLFTSKIRINYSALLLFSCVMYICLYYLAFFVLGVIQNF